MNLSPYCKSERCLRDAGKSLNNVSGIVKDTQHLFGDKKNYCPDCGSFMVWKRSRSEDRHFPDRRFTRGKEIRRHGPNL